MNWTEIVEACLPNAKGNWTAKDWAHWAVLTIASGILSFILLSHFGVIA